MDKEIKENQEEETTQPSDVDSLAKQLQEQGISQGSAQESDDFRTSKTQNDNEETITRLIKVFVSASQDNLVCTVRFQPDIAPVTYINLLSPEKALISTFDDKLLMFDIKSKTILHEINLDRVSFTFQSQMFMDPEVLYLNQMENSLIRGRMQKTQFVERSKFIDINDGCSLDDSFRVILNYLVLSSNEVVVFVNEKILASSPSGDDLGSTPCEKDHGNTPSGKDHESTQSGKDHRITVTEENHYALKFDKDGKQTKEEKLMEKDKQMYDGIYSVSENKFGEICMAVSIKNESTASVIALDKEFQQLFKSSSTVKDRFPTISIGTTINSNILVLHMASYIEIFHRNGELWGYFPPNEYLPLGTPSQIAVDDENKAWIATTDGRISCIQLNKEIM